MDVELQNNRKTLKDYLLLKHYQFSKLNAKEQRQIVNQALIRQETIKNQRQETMKQLKQRNSKVNQPNVDNNDNILNQIKNDILYVSFESPHKPGIIMKYKIKAGSLILEQPYIILTMQDISSEFNLNDLKIKSTKTDIIFIKSINEIRDKVVKIINFISSQRFFPLKSSNAFFKNNNKFLDESYPIAMSQTSDQQNYNFSRNQQFNSQVQENRFKNDDFNDFSYTPQSKSKKDLYQQIQISNDQNQVSPTHTELNLISTYREPKAGKLQTTINESNNIENIKQLEIIQQSQHIEQVVNLLHPLRSCNISSSKNNKLLMVPTKEQSGTQQASSIILNNSIQFQGKFGEKVVLSRIFDSKENEETSENGSETKSVPKLSFTAYQSTQQNIQSDRKSIKKSINQSQNDDDSFQILENEDNEINKSLLKLRLSCLLNNTYSLLDYLILSNEKSYFKRLSVKPQMISLFKLDSYLKVLFPNLIIQYHSPGLQDKEINTDIRRLKYVLISIISSFQFQKKNGNLQLSNRFKQTSMAQQIQSDLSPLQQKNRLNGTIYQSIFQDYDRFLEIYLDVFFNEEPQFSSINFSVQSIGSNDPQEQQNQNNQQINSQDKKRSDSISYQLGKISRKSENEFLSQLVEGNFCANATSDPIIKQMEAKNIYCNIMAIGPYNPEFEPIANVFSFEIFENIEIIDQNFHNQVTPYESPLNQNFSQAINNMNFIYNKSVQISQQLDLQALRNSRKSNFYMGNGSPQNTTPSIKSQDTTLKKKNGQQSKSKFNSTENIFNKKKLQVNDLIKQLEIAIIKENIHSYNEEGDSNSFRTFTSGLEQEIEECFSDTEYNTRQIPMCQWNKQTDKLNTCL